MRSYIDLEANLHFIIVISLPLNKLTQNMVCVILKKTRNRSISENVSRVWGFQITYLIIVLILSHYGE